VVDVCYALIDFAPRCRSSDPRLCVPADAASAGSFFASQIRTVAQKPDELDSLVFQTAMNILKMLGIRQPVPQGNDRESLPQIGISC
jgi:hypothetical protein